MGSLAQTDTAMKRKTVLLFDVDNTLLDNDRVTADLRDHLEREVGHERQERYWSIFEELREKLATQITSAPCSVIAQTTLATCTCLLFPISSLNIRSEIVSFLMRLRL